MTVPSVATPRMPVLGALATQILRRAALGIAYGQISVHTPGGQVLAIGRPGSGPRATLFVHDWAFVWRLLAHWDLGFAQSYLAGEWSTPDLPALLNILCRNTALSADSRALGLLRSWQRIAHWWNRNTRRGSRRNISAHYDLGNAFYKHWLDPGLTYSSALYDGDNQTLESAQDAKLERIVELMELSDGQRVLEIGCGWGGLAERLLERQDCSFSGLTLSAEQLAFAEARLQRFHGRRDFDIRLQDYRDADGAYDRVVSIEMLEAVGESYWPAYFNALYDRLRPGGIAVLQAITIAEENFAVYRRYPDFIQAHVFPGGMLPTVEIMKAQLARSGLTLQRVEFFGGSYARTLADWRTRFQAARPEIVKLGFDGRFQRMWEYYLAYCQAGFEAGVLNVGLYKAIRAA